MNSFMKALEGLDWEQLKQGVDFVRDGRGISYDIRFQVFDYDGYFVEVQAQNLDGDEETVNFTRNDLEDVRQFIIYYMTVAGEITVEDLDGWYICK